MKTAKELYDYNTERDYGKFLNDKTTMNIFQYCARQLKKEEDAKVAFLGILYYQPSAQFVHWYGVVITDSRLIVGLSGFFGREVKIFELNDFVGVSAKDGATYSTITFHHPKKDINIGVNRHALDSIFEDILNNTNLKNMDE